QEEHNVKAVLKAPGEVESSLAREIGIARYERIGDFDTTPGDEYWAATAQFWGEVRNYWDEAMQTATRIRLKPEVDGRKLFQPLFERARAIADGGRFTPEENSAFISETIDAFRATPGDSTSAEY
ncbi:MAG: hypothetical protein KGY49_06425, partial [Wenzhouxiangellaceae bacterium]|nr:hypothetical protein [Wenzhouxiangellaceae bacterium]